MCGIAGIFAWQKRRNDLQETVEGFAKALETRGPDALGIWVSPDQEIAFAHRRLSIIDTGSRSNQPMHSADGRHTIVFNGEIYNYRELRQELEARGRVFVTTSDTEVLLQLYAEFGPAMLDRLRGMFAFAIWDKTEEQLFLARDPLGIKPLYYALGDGQLYFASQVRALLNAPGVDLSEEPAAHVGFFVWGSVPEPYTLYRGIHCLPSGSWMTIRPRGPQGPHRYCSPVDEFANFAPDAMPRSEGEMRERLHDALEESVRMHEVADVPVAIFLSAGIDSGVIASLASEGTDSVETLTLGFDLLRGLPADETEPAARVARQYGLPNTVQFIDRSLFTAHRQRLLEQMDQPTIDGVNVYFVSWLARERGFKVALSGLGGDELFGGYPSFRQVPRTVHMLSGFRGLSRLGRGWRVMTAPLLRRLTSPKYASLLEYGGTWGGAYLLRRGLFMPWELPEFLDPDLVREGWRDLDSIGQMNALVKPMGFLPGVASEQADFLRVSALEMSYYMRTQLLRDADWAGMAHSVEIRVPFVDMPLLRQIAALRASPFSPRKPEFVHALKRPLPAEIIDRPKTGFSVPVREWMQENPQRGLRHWAMHVYRAHQERTSQALAEREPSALRPAV